MPSANRQSGRILVIGSLNVDLITCAPSLPRPGETVIGGTFHVAPGGKGANQAVAAARMGAPVTMIGRVGDDDFGRLVRGELERVGVDVTHVRVDPSVATGTGQIVIDASGQNAIAVASGANERVNDADVIDAASAWEGAALVVLQLEIPLAPIGAAIAQALARRMPVVLNAAPAHSLPPDMLRAVSWLVVNEVEAEQLLGCRPLRSMADAAAAAAALRHQGQRVVVTLGASGALLLGDGGTRHVPAPTVDVIDTTAAGDAFVGALAAALLRGSADVEAVHEAVVAGSLACTKLGAIPSLPARAAVVGFTPN